MRNIKRAGVVMAAALSALVIIGASPGAAQGDLDCGDPGTFHNMPVSPDDPNGLDADDDGIGCEDGSVFGAAPPPAPQAVAQPGEPTFTG